MLSKIVADQSVDYRIIRYLKDSGSEILAIQDKYSGIPDDEVLEISINNKSILITEDSDFGEWIFAHKKKAIGVVFLRYHHTELNEIKTTLLKVLNETKLFGKFIVITSKKVRKRDLI